MRLALLFAALFSVSLLHAQLEGDPVDPDACTLREIGRMEGWLSCRGGNGQQFGVLFANVGDVNGDSLTDWCVGYARCDTSLPRSSGYLTPPLRLRLYTGTAQFPPSSTSGTEIGPDELGADVKLLASGDFDGDLHRDLVVSLAIYADTIDGTTGVRPERLVVYWGDGTGHFSNADTSHLQNARSLWVVLSTAVAYRLPGEHVDRLLVRGGYTWKEGQPVATPHANIFVVPTVGKRWGRDGVSRQPVWGWWGCPEMSFGFVDADGDAYQDFCLIRSGSPDQSQITIAYGQPDGSFDTVNVESVSLLAANCRSTIFTDLTGDGLPEIACNCGSQEQIKVYVGKRGQRLLKQYGSGDDPPNPGSDDWWARPWATVWLPKRFDSTHLPLGSEALFALGDLGHDRIGDVVVQSMGTLLVYNGGARLDSLVDGFIPVPGSTPALTNAKRLGNIDGSGQSVIAVRYGLASGELVFYHPDSCVGRTWGTYHRDVPEGTGPSSVRREYTPAPALEFSVSPTPARDRVVVSWQERIGNATLTLSDLVGHELQRRSVSASLGSLPLDVARLSRGSYLLYLSIAGRSGSTPLMLC